jgi:hypothetical protein
VRSSSRRFDAARECPPLVGIVALLAGACTVDSRFLASADGAGATDRGQSSSPDLSVPDGGQADADSGGDASGDASDLTDRDARDGGDAEVASSAGDAGDAGVLVDHDARDAVDGVDAVDAVDLVADADAASDLAEADAADSGVDSPVADSGMVTDLVDAADGAPVDGASYHRDWNQNPPVFLQTGVARLWGLSDVHGDRDRLIALLVAGGLIGGSSASPTWTAGTDTLVVSGDSIDKGPQSIEVLDTWIALIPQAATAGGHLVVLFGNHEAEFLADPYNSKAAPLVAELGSTSPAFFASSDDPYGRFLRERPIAAVVDGWFFSHAGNSGGQTMDQIGVTFHTLVDADAWSDPFFLDANSILEARNWWPTANTNGFLDGYLAALPALHIVFGHRPTTFADPPSGNIEVHQQGRLVLIDVGMSRAVNYSTGKLLRVDHPGTPLETVNMITPAGSVVPLNMAAP